MKITTNNVPRNYISWDQLTQSEKDDYDWMTEDTRICADFFKYKGMIFNRSEFVKTEVGNWDGIYGLTAFSGVVIRFPNSYSVVCGWLSA